MKQVVHEYIRQMWLKGRTLDVGSYDVNGSLRDLFDDYVGVDMREDGLNKIAVYADELQKWNKAYNLVGRNIGLEGIIDLYVDALTPLAIRGIFDAGKEVVDIGSGAGLPGIPLYLLAGPFSLTLVESQRKKNEKSQSR